MQAVLCAWQQKQPEPVPEEPPEEDASVKEKEYSFNPLQAEKEIKVGDYYQKKGNYKAAAMRYSEATKWNPGGADAWLKLGDMRERLNDLKAAKEAWSKYIELAPDAKKAADIKRKLRKSG